LRILYVVTEDWYFSSHRLILARAALAQGHQVAVLVGIGSLGRELREAGLEVFPWRISRGSVHPFREIRALLDVYLAYRKFRPDLAHHIALKPIAYGGLVAALLGVPSVNAVAGRGAMFHGRGLKAIVGRNVIKLLMKIAAHGSSVALFQLAADRDEMVKLGAVRKDKTEIIRGAGVDLNEFSPSQVPSGVPIILIAGRILWDKGLAEFVAAANKIREKGIAARFVVAGSYDPHNPTGIRPEQVQAWVSDGSIEYLGPRNDMANVISQATICCVPSYHEGVPKVLLEACASGKAVVVSDIPGCREVIQDDVNGLVIPARDADALAMAIQRLLGDAELRRRLGTNARTTAVEQFSQDEVIRRTLEIYSHLLPSELRATV
jgi:glycosyltransferase involved in cell wall biosynthesis